MLLLFDTPEKLIVEQSSEILGVSHISWENSPWRQLSLVDDEEVISLSHAKVLCIFRFCVMLWKGESEPSIKYCLGRTVGLVQRFTTIQNVGHNWRRADGIRVEYFPRIHHTAALQQSPKVHKRPSSIPRTNCLHVDVQWHHMGIYREWTRMHC